MESYRVPRKPKTIKRRLEIAFSAIETDDRNRALKGLTIIKNLKFKNDVDLIKTCWIGLIEADVNFIDGAESMLLAPLATIEGQLNLIQELSAIKLNKDYSVRRLRDLLLEEKL
jgi:hypothetical protein